MGLFLLGVPVVLSPIDAESTWKSLLLYQHFHLIVKWKCHINVLVRAFLAPETGGGFMAVKVGDLILCELCARAVLLGCLTLGRCMLQLCLVEAVR